MPDRPIEEVQARYAARLMSLPGVTAVYQAKRADGSDCIKVIVLDRSPELMQKLPKDLEGYPVVVEVSGPIRPL